MKHTENVRIYICHDLINVQQRQISHYNGEGKTPEEEESIVMLQTKD